MPTFCCCHNELDAEPSFKVTQTPCKCEDPGPGRGAKRVRFGIPDMVFEQQYNERRALGLPVETSIEQGMRNRWI